MEDETSNIHTSSLVPAHQLYFEIEPAIFYGAFIGLPSMNVRFPFCLMFDYRVG
jgi:hypothetical protein